MQVLNAHRITRAVQRGPSCIRPFAASSVALRLPASACQHTRNSSVQYQEASTPSSSTCHLEGHADQLPVATSTMQQPSFPSRQHVALAAAACVAVTASCLLFAGPAAAAAASGAAAASSNPVAGLLSFILHLEHHLASLISTQGSMVYAILFAIVFAETGLVLTPFLPGDSLLFAAGAFAGMGKLSVGILMAVFIVSAILGDAVNYAVGNKLGAVAIQKGIVKKEFVEKTEKFYAKYGGKTVVLARFVPIVRTFAPFVAGVGSMSYSQFALYNVGGAILWTVLFVGAGFFFGNLPFVQKNFTAVVLGIVAVSVVPVVWEIIQARKEAASEERS